MAKKPIFPLQAFDQPITRALSNLCIQREPERITGIEQEGNELGRVSAAFFEKWEIPGIILNRSMKTAPEVVMNAAGNQCIIGFRAVFCGALTGSDFAAKK